MSDEEDHLEFVLAWVSQYYERLGNDKFHSFSPATRFVVSYVVVSGQIFNGGLPSVYYNSCGYLIPDMIACLRKINENDLADLVEIFDKAVAANPYYGPPELWPTEAEPENARTDSEVRRLESLDDNWLSLMRQTGEEEIYRQLARLIKEDSPAT